MGDKWVTEEKDGVIRHVGQRIGWNDRVRWGLRSAKRGGDYLTKKYTKKYGKKRYSSRRRKYRR